MWAKGNRRKRQAPPQRDQFLVNRSDVKIGPAIRCGSPGRWRIQLGGSKGLRKWDFQWLFEVFANIWSKKFHGCFKEETVPGVPER